MAEQDQTTDMGTPQEEQFQDVGDQNVGEVPADTGDPNSLKLKVSGKEIDWDINDPRTTELLQKGYHYSQEMENLKQQKQGLDDWVNQQADARAQQIAYQQQQQIQEDRYRELEQEDPYAASIQRLQDQVANVQRQVQQDTSQLKNQVAQSAWETKKAEFAKQHPDLKSDDWDTIYAKVALGTPMESAVNERASYVNSYRQQIISEHTNKLKQNSTLPPASGGGSGAPIPSSEEKKYANFSSADHIADLKAYMDQMEQTE
jgi:hypothetical protein